MDDPTPHKQPELSPEILKAIAHPIRLSLYEALLAGGPATAARLAPIVPGAPASLSYHLRQLAASGFIQEAPDLSKDARERWWRAVPGGINWAEEDLERSPGTRKAAAAAESVLLGRQVERIRTWVRDAHSRWSSQWRASAMNVDSILVLEASELQQLGKELDQVLESWRTVSRERADRDGPRPDSRESVFVSIHAFPFNPSARP